MNNHRSKGKRDFFTKSALTFILSACCLSCFAQEKLPYVRIVNIVVDSVQLENFKDALKKHIKLSIPTESGILTLHVLYDKENPTHVTVFEIYRDKEAHIAHQKTSHFLEYRKITAGMVKSTARFEMLPIVLETKPIPAWYENQK